MAKFFIHRPIFAAALEAAEQFTRLNVTTLEINRPRLNATLAHC